MTILSFFAGILIAVVIMFIVILVAGNWLDRIFKLGKYRKK